MNHHSKKKYATDRWKTQKIKLLPCIRGYNIEIQTASKTI